MLHWKGTITDYAGIIVGHVLRQEGAQHEPRRSARPNFCAVVDSTDQPDVAYATSGWSVDRGTAGGGIRLDISKPVTSGAKIFGVITANYGLNTIRLLFGAGNCSSMIAIGSREPSGFTNRVKIRRRNRDE